LVDNLKKKYNIDPTANRRLKNLYTKTHYYEEELTATLRSLGFEEGGTRLRLERGRPPQYGNYSIRVKIQSKYSKEGKPTEVDIVTAPTEKVEELYDIICNA